MPTDQPLALTTDFQRLALGERLVLLALPRSLPYDGGVAALCSLITLPCRTVERAVASLDRRGFLRRSRRGRGRTAVLTLTPAGREVVLATGARSDSPVTASDFIGDPIGLKTALVARRIGHDASPNRLGELYVEHATPEEQARLLDLLDDYDEIPAECAPTGNAELDDGLRSYFHGRAHRRRSRQQTRRSWGFGDD